jgi:hypothetical protein
LLKTNIYEIFSENIILEFSKILLLDDKTDLSNLTEKELSKFRQYLNPNFWYRIKQDNQRNRFNKEKTKYNKLLDKTGNHLKKQLDKIVFEKLEYLKSGAVSTPDKNIKSSAVSSIIYSEIGTQNKTATCKVTGLNISMQKRNSILLSHTGLKYYSKNDKPKFEELKKQYLSKLWQNSNLEKQIKEIAHNIRNTYCNQGIKQKRIYRPEQLQLF